MKNNVLTLQNLSKGNLNHYRQLTTTTFASLSSNQTVLRTSNLEEQQIVQRNHQNQSTIILERNFYRTNHSQERDPKHHEIVVEEVDDHYQYMKTEGVEEHHIKGSKQSRQKVFEMSQKIMQNRGNSAHSRSISRVHEKTMNHGLHHNPLTEQLIKFSFSQILKESAVQKYQPGLSHNYLPKYLTLGQTCKGQIELRIYKSRWQFRLF